MIVKTRSWQKVTKFYRDITEKNTFFRPMLDLAEQIAASKYARGLFPLDFNADPLQQPGRRG